MKVRSGLKGLKQDAEKRSKEFDRRVSQHSVSDYNKKIQPVGDGI